MIRYTNVQLLVIKVDHKNVAQHKLLQIMLPDHHCHHRNQNRHPWHRHHH